MTNLPKNGLRAYVITRMKVLGALVRPKGMSSHSNNPSFVLKAVFHSSLGRIRILWYPLRRSIFVKNEAPFSKSNMSSSRGMGNLYFIFILFIARLSRHIRQLLSFLGVSKTGTAQGLRLSRIKP